MTANLAALQQLTTVTWDGNIISKTSRDWLIRQGLCERVNGWNYITKKGVKLLITLGGLKP